MTARARRRYDRDRKRRIRAIAPDVRPGLRWRILERDGFACRYCGGRAPTAELHVDHVVPRAKGGQSVADNLVTACALCNVGKGHR